MPPRQPGTGTWKAPPVVPSICRDLSIHLKLHGPSVLAYSKCRQVPQAHPSAAWHNLPGKHLFIKRNVYSKLLRQVILRAGVCCIERRVPGLNSPSHPNASRRSHPRGDFAEISAYSKTYLRARSISSRVDKVQSDKRRTWTCTSLRLHPRPSNSKSVADRVVPVAEATRSTPLPLWLPLWTVARKPPGGGAFVVPMPWASNAE